MKQNIKRFFVSSLFTPLHVSKQSGKFLSVVTMLVVLCGSMLATNQQVLAQTSTDTPTPTATITVTPTATRTTTPTATPTYAATNTVERISLDSSQTEGNSTSQSPSISANGRFVVFSSTAANLVANDTNGVEDVFLRDRLNGTTTRISMGLSGAEANGASSLPTISPDGRYVGFASFATNLVANDANSNSDAFIYDTQTGTTICISVDSTGATGNNQSNRPYASPDGNYWIFTSLANNLVAGDTLVDTDLFVYNQSAGTLTRVGMPPDGEPNGNNTNGVLSNGALSIAFKSLATNLQGAQSGSPEYVDSNDAADIFYYSTVTNTMLRISVNDAGQTANGASDAPAISANGRFVAFSSAASNLVSDDTNNVSDIFIRDISMNTIERVSIGDYGQQANGASSYPSISSDGRYVAFSSTADNLITNDTNGVSDIFIRDLQTGDTRRVSIQNNYYPAEGPSALEGNGDSSGRVSFAANQSYLVYASSSSNLVTGDTNGVADIFAMNFGAVMNWAYFTATPAPTLTPTLTPTPYGQMNITGNAGVAWATLSYIDGTLKIVTADANGNYSLPISPAWSGTVKVSRMGYTFTPASRVYSPDLMIYTGQNYSATFTGLVSVGEYYSCLLKSNGTLACWGDTTYNKNYPPTGTFAQLSTGYNHACAIRTDGTLACWGANIYGESTPPTGTFIQVSAGVDYSCGVKSDSTVACWGRNALGESMPPSGTFIQVSAGNYHTCGVKPNGAIICWGDAFGNGLPPSGEFTQVSVGYNNTCGLQSDGKLACWNYGLTITQPNDTITQVSMGHSHGCALKPNGTLACWGQNTNGESTPPTVGTFTQVSAGGEHSCAMMNNGKITCWGSNNLNQSLPFSISGDINGAGSVTLSYDDAGPKTVIAYGVGSYSIPVPYNWSGVVVPSLSGYIFSPTSRTYTNVVSNQMSQNYNALTPTPTRTPTPTITPTPTPVTVTFDSIAAQDGWILETSPGSLVGGTMNNTNNTFAIGDDAANRQYRAILSFGTASLPDNAIIQSAVLKIQENAIVGQNPFVIFNNLWADMTNGAFGSTALELSDFNAAADATAVGAFNKTPVNGWYSLTLNATGRNLVNRLPGGTQFRLRFNPATNTDGVADFMKFISGDYTTYQPELVITYTLP